MDAIEEIDGDTPEAKLAFLNTCNCCERHQSNKPITYSPWHDCESNGMHWQCECNCRHMARWICRLCPDSDYDIVLDEALQNNLLVTTTPGITEDEM